MAGRENTDPLPNPWASQTTSTGTSSTTTTNSTASSGQTGMTNTKIIKPSLLSDIFLSLFFK
jgi:hypothetical protein